MSTASDPIPPRQQFTSDNRSGICPEAFNALALARLRGLGRELCTFIGVGGARMMCSWDTTEADVDQLVDDVKRSAVRMLVTHTHPQHD